MDVSLESVILSDLADAIVQRSPTNANVVPSVRLRSIHDVLTYQDFVSDPTEMLDRNPMIYKPPRGQRPIDKAAPQEGQPKNLKLRSIHDILTPREKNSDPTEEDK